MSSWWKKWYWFAAALALTLVAFAAVNLWPRGQSLFLADGDGKVFYSHPIRKGESFTLLFIHSVAKTPVEEVFQITGPEEFTLRETRYQDFGAGLPHEELPGQQMAFGEGRIRISGLNTKFNRLTLRVGHTADHAIILPDGAKVRLADFQRRGGEVRVVVGEKRGLLEGLF